MLGHEELLAHHDALAAGAGEADGVEMPAQQQSATTGGTPAACATLDPGTADFYRCALRALIDNGVPFLVEELRPPDKPVTVEKYIQYVQHFVQHENLNVRTEVQFDDIRDERDGLSVEFDGMWSSSLTDSTARGKPDIEAVDISSRLQGIGEIFEVTTKPLVFDGDTGGKPEHFAFTVRSLERIGVSAVIIEDKEGLKRNSRFGTDVAQTQSSIEDFCTRLSIGKQAQITDDFMIIARIESLILEQGMEDAVTRAKAYIEGGADGKYLLLYDPLDGSGNVEVDGPMGSIFSVLGEYGVNVVAIAQGSSELNITIAIAEEDATRALQALDVRARDEGEVPETFPSGE